MHFRGVIQKMISEFDNPVRYYLNFEDDMLCMNQLLNREIKIKFIGYAFQIEMKFATYLLGFKIKEIPILFSDREEGVSKMSGGIVKEAVMGVLQMRFWAFSNSYSR